MIFVHFVSLITFTELTTIIVCGLMHGLLCVHVNQATTGGGGWPMSVWLTPDLEPIVGGTYFPPDDSYNGQPGFKTILTRISTVVCLTALIFVQSENVHLI